jgi:aspartyl-tRNA(Asn)/glutamyl-tRNA(Gln) amidotransferase subunit A
MKIEAQSNLTNKIEILDNFNIFTSINPHKSLKLKSNGKLSKLAFAIKDNICTKDFPTTAASSILQNFEPGYDSTAVKRIKKAGGQIIGKTNLDEFAMGSSSEFSLFGPVKNPLNEKYSAGGSSGGSAAAVAADLCDVALGSDTGGSVRQPAAFCGVIGFKPTYGMISRYGLIAFASSLDQIGILSKEMKLIKKTFKVIGGKDDKDATSLLLDNDSNPFDIKEFKIGILPSGYLINCSEKIKVEYQKLIETLKDRGVKTKEIDLPIYNKWLSIYHVVACAEASSNLARYDGSRYGIARNEDLYSFRSKHLGDEVKRRIIMGTYVLSRDNYNSYYLKSMRLREAIKRGFDKIFHDVDFIITPTTPTRAFRLGTYKANPIDYYHTDQYLVGPSLAGLPAVSLPFFPKKEELPVGFQLFGNWYKDLHLLELSDYFLKNLLK